MTVPLVFVSPLTQSPTFYPSMKRVCNVFPAVCKVNLFLNNSCQSPTCSQVITGCPVQTKPEAFVRRAASSSHSAWNRCKWFCSRRLLLQFSCTEGHVGGRGRTDVTLAVHTSKQGHKYKDSVDSAPVPRRWGSYICYQMLWVRNSGGEKLTN